MSGGERQEDHSGEVEDRVWECEELLSDGNVKKTKDTIKKSASKSTHTANTNGRHMTGSTPAVGDTEGEWSAWGGVPMPWNQQPNRGLKPIGFDPRQIGVGQPNPGGRGSSAEQRARAPGDGQEPAEEGGWD